MPLLNNNSVSRANGRLIAFYLPQFHPIPENDAWWGKGFTEWTNTAKAKPLFPGHCQPSVPADLGFYDLRLPEARAAQAALAREYGIEGFCYWHYWFAGRRLLERPFDEVLKSDEPDFPFCLAWANETWTGIWHGAANKFLVEQTYPGLDDHERHFNYLLGAFSDERYIKVDGKPLFLVYQPHKLPDAKLVTDFWRELALKAGLKGLHLVACLHNENAWDPAQLGFDAVNISNQVKIMEVAPPTWTGRLARYLRIRYRKALGHPPHIYAYKDAMRHFLDGARAHIECYPSVVPGWDNTPRSGTRGVVLCGSTPELFQEHLREAIDRVSCLPVEHRLVFVKSWNEWAEGNYLEPDLRFGRRYLEAVRNEVLRPAERAKDV